MAIYHLGWQSVLKTVPGVATVPVGSTMYSKNAGYAICNGTYTYLQDSRYTQGYAAYINYVGGEWRYTNFNNTDRYYFNTFGNANNIPLTGWQVGTAAAPAPTISTTP